MLRLSFLSFSAMQKRLYKDLLTKNVSALQGAEGAGRTQLLNLAMQLRKACNHPYLFEGIYISLYRFFSSVDL